MGLPKLIVLVLSSTALASCESLSGFPTDPIDDKADIAAMLASSSSAQLTAYQSLHDKDQRRRLRNQIVYARIDLYDIAFSNFERDITGQGNGSALGGDTIGAILTAFSTAVKNTASKTTFSAAALGLTGITSDITKDLFYKNTVSAILSQMEASRTKVLARIETSISTLDDDQYPLEEALIDLEKYKNSGSIPGAINTVAANAGAASAAAQSAIDAVRNIQYVSTATSKMLSSWLYPNGTGKPINGGRRQQLENWMANDKLDPTLASLPFEQLVNGQSVQFEADRARAIAALSIH